MDAPLVINLLLNSLKLYLLCDVVVNTAIYSNVLFNGIGLQLCVTHE